jgi:hypothetical protein
MGCEPTRERPGIALTWGCGKHILAIRRAGAIMTRMIAILFSLTALGLASCQGERLKETAPPTLLSRSI